MIATCPACARRYRLADDAVPAGGRHVRCAACGHGWTVLPGGEAAPADLSPSATPGPGLAADAAPALPPRDAANDGPAATMASAVISTTGPVEPQAVVTGERLPSSEQRETPSSFGEQGETPTLTTPPRRRRHFGWIAAVVAVLAVGALAVIEFAPEATFDPPRLGLPAARLPLADLGSLSVPALPALPSLPPLDLTRVPLVGDRLDALVNPPAAPATPLRVTASGERRILPNGTRVLTVTGTVANPTDAPVALTAIDAALLDASGHVAFRWRIAAPASVVAAHAGVAFDTVAANYPAGATVLRLRPR